jgi:ATP-dependent RNA helicase RhlE
MAGRDVVGIAQTGTGKTLAFGLPMIARLRGYQTGLVLAPTRELAQQIEETYKKLGVKTALIIGGAAMGPQIGQLRRSPQVIIATPGRLMDHMAQGTVEMRTVAIVVLDEADRMLDMGFAPAIRKIMEAVPKERQTMLFSATMPQEIYSLAERYMKNPERVEIERAGTAAETVEQELLVVHHEDKQNVLGGLLKENEGTVLVFARTRHGARKLARTIRSLGHTAAELHSDRTLAQRREALDGFKRGTYRVLVATDIAARGIDVKEIALVVNFDVPENPEDYVHRIGRTGRAGASGRAITLATPEQHRDVRDIEKLLKTELPLGANSPMTLQRPKPAGRSPIATPPRRTSSRRPIIGPRR